LHGNNHILAPYWADVDTTGTGKIFYRQTADPSLLARASSEIQRAYGLSQNFAIRNLFIATWYKVGLFPSRTDKVNQQCISTYALAYAYIVCICCYNIISNSSINYNSFAL